MPLNLTINKAAEIAGSQTKLAELLGVARPHISNWKQGSRTCTIDKRIKLAQIAGLDPTTAVLEGLADQLDENDQWQKQAKETLNAILNAFPQT
ncbi:YdaS antitoxin of YdaST toxin-antitoxin system [Acidovorax sp. 69]|uniref:YdaS family helix-turn-helix protein n=1 Tax=Acidovorax sp. 69 TaxID=2035202 RepID=UPI000C24A57D|nr:YdaS family helix-turn-helix protein [Acidovorax sp. 69]PJI97935.1 YdaS antitoxin of YdaST toxin-antitoxin system [Acidovorax sp. 69]